MSDQDDQDDQWIADNREIIIGLVVLGVLLCCGCFCAFCGGFRLIEGLISAVLGIFTNCCGLCGGGRGRVRSAGTTVVVAADGAGKKGSARKGEGFSCALCMNSCLGCLLCGGDCCGLVAKHQTQLRNKVTSDARVIRKVEAEEPSSLPLLSIV